MPPKVDTPHCWGRLVFLQPLPKIHTSHQYLEDFHWFEAILKNFGRAIFEAIELKGHSMLNFEVTTSKICNHIWKFGCQPQKSKTVLCMTNGSKVLIYLSFLLFLKEYFLNYWLSVSLVRGFLREREKIF